MNKTLVFALGVCLCPIAAISAEADKDALILRLKVSNLEFAIENMELQRQNLAFKIEALKAQRDKLAAGVESENKGKSK